MIKIVLVLHDFLAGYSELCIYWPAFVDRSLELERYRSASAPMFKIVADYSELRMYGPTFVSDHPSWKGIDGQVSP